MAIILTACILSVTKPETVEVISQLEQRVSTLNKKFGALRNKYLEQCWPIWSLGQNGNSCGYMCYM